VYLTKLVDGRACWQHLRRSTHLAAHYMSVNCKPLTPLPRHLLQTWQSLKHHVHWITAHKSVIASCHQRCLITWADVRNLSSLHKAVVYTTDNACCSFSVIRSWKKYWNYYWSISYNDDALEKVSKVTVWKLYERIWLEISLEWLNLDHRIKSCSWRVNDVWCGPRSTSEQKKCWQHDLYWSV